MKVISAIVIGTLLAVQLLAQSGGSMKRDIKRPAVFLSLESIGRLQTTGMRKGEKRVRLKLSNNLKSSIKLEASGPMDEREDIRLYYEVIDKKGNLLMSQNCHVCSIIELGPGKSVVFGIPYKDLDDAGSVRVQFAFPWEDNTVVGPATEPKHFVYFYIRDLLSATSGIVPDLPRRK